MSVRSLVRIRWAIGPIFFVAAAAWAAAAPVLGTSGGALRADSPLPAWLQATHATTAILPDGSARRQELQTLSDRLRDLDPETDFYTQEYGMEMAIDGDTLAVGAHLDGAQGLELGTGSVYLYRREGGEWVPVQRLRDGVDGDCFGCGLALKGDRLLVGAPSRNWEDDPPGKVYVYTRNNGIWTLTNQFSAGDASPADSFGAEFAFDGSRLFVYSKQGVRVGSLDDQGEWTETGRLTGDTPAFGAPLVLRGDRLLIGASTEAIDGVVRVGAVYAFTASDGGWSRTQKLSVGTQNALFGHSIALDGDALLVGAVGEGTIGAAYAFAFQNGAWALQQTFRPDTEEREQRFGFAVALRGTEAAIGCTLSPYQGQGANGAVYTYASNAGTWERTDKLRRVDRDITDTGAVLGYRLAWDGSAVIASSPRRRVGRNATVGAVSVFDFPPQAMAAPTALTLATTTDGTASTPLALGNGGGSQLRFRHTDGTELAQMDVAQITPGDGVSCHDDSGSRANSWYRRYAFADHPQVGASASVRAVTVATESGPATDGVIKLYTMPRGVPPETIDLGLLTPIGSGSGEVGGVMTTTTIPVAGTVGDTANQDLVVEFHIDGSSPTPYFPGGNPSPETHATLMLASDCGVEAGGNPTAYLHQNFHLLMSVQLDTASVAAYCADPAATPWLSVTPAEGWVRADTAQDLAVRVDAPALAPGEYDTPLCFATNDPAQRLLRVPLTVEVSASERIFADGFDGVAP